MILISWPIKMTTKKNRVHIELPKDLAVEIGRAIWDDISQTVESLRTQKKPMSWKSDYLKKKGINIDGILFYDDYDGPVYLSSVHRWAWDIWLSTAEMFEYFSSIIKDSPLKDKYKYTGVSSNMKRTLDKNGKFNLVIFDAEHLHWHLMIIRGIETLNPVEIYIMDSLSISNEKYKSKALKNIQDGLDNLKKKWKVIPVPSVNQTGGSDCGVHAAMYLRAILMKEVDIFTNNSSLLEYSQKYMQPDAVLQFRYANVTRITTRHIKWANSFLEQNQIPPFFGQYGSKERSELIKMNPGVRIIEDDDDSEPEILE